MNKEANLWKCEYENLRRKKNKEIEKLKRQQAEMCDITFNLLKTLGMNEEDICEYYKVMKEELKWQRDVCFQNK